MAKLQTKMEITSKEHEKSLSQSKISYNCSLCPANPCAKCGFWEIYNRLVAKFQSPKFRKIFNPKTNFATPKNKTTTRTTAPPQTNRQSLKNYIHILTILPAPNYLHNNHSRFKQHYLNKFLLFNILPQ